MKSLEELLTYYQGIHKGAFATTELHFGLSPGQIDLGENRKDIDAALLYEADRLTKAAVASYLACSRLRSGGHRTWGEITVYYSQFQIISAILRLVGIAPNNNLLLLRTDEVCRKYVIATRKDPNAKKVGFTGGGSHRETWRMFSRYFSEWKDEEPPKITASLRREAPEIEKWSFQSYELPVIMRNETNYLQSNAGIFFPETDLTGLQEWTIGTARTMGEWDWLRTDDNPMSDEEPPEAYFFAEMMAWDLIKYVIKVLVTLEGKYLLDQYIWIIENLDAYHELREHMINDLRSVPIGS